MFGKSTLILAAALALTPCAPVSAQTDDFYPIMLAFDGTDNLNHPAVPALDINGYGTIEFWVSAQWTNDPGYDPAIMAYVGKPGPRFAFHITADRKALGVYAGKYYDTVPFDFSDGALHYVAITTAGDAISVMIDGEAQDTLGFGFADVPPAQFTIGSIGGFSPFIGEIGQIRIWDDLIDPDTLLDFSWKEITSDGPNAHPDIDSLVAFSAFGNPATGGFVFVGDLDEVEALASKAETFDESGLDLVGLDTPVPTP